ncbi:1-acyl-sn-glycerol-3-phosphate acyltransferase [Prevotella sp. E13-17]|uniref:lysophospholipid acyltransferase family protein n=1 Tax=Prevotella sp. E13-17 TaxID=2913616 RepID=UPI001EDA237B|nr:lysophospholipid acyltransferase family protein [Prevotella sp. E13-17]UKK50429.1 1-acyl-sn-glycerol-3-phosphate acyltransferase [Prevotella sp. E13-17]
MKYLYRIYQLFVALPIILMATVLVVISISVGCAVGSGHFWGYYPAHIWARVILWALLIPVKVEGRAHLEKDQSYVFVANHQGAFDIFLIYGFLNRNFKWMMKYQLRNIPFVGYACERSHQIFVDKRGPKKIKATYDKARATLQGGTSLTVFPEGSRTFTGHMGVFKRGAFALADELQLPVVPLTINGSFNVMPRMRDMKFVLWHPLTLTIHQPIYPVGQGPDNVEATKNQAYDSVMSALVPEYQGYVENPDQ